MIFFRLLFIIAISIFVSCTQTDTNDNKPTIDLTGSTDTKIYFAQMSDHLFFVMEPVSSLEDVDKWDKFFKDREQIRSSVIKPLVKKFGHIQAKRHVQGALEKLAFASTNAVAEDALKLIKNFTQASTWMAYVSDTRPNGKISLSNMESIEMSVGVASQMGLPMQVHLGIIRSLAFLQAGKTTTPKLSLKLHGFIAKTMKKIDPAKRLLITKPLDSMARIFQDNLKPEFYRFYVEDGAYNDFAEESKAAFAHLPAWINTNGENTANDNFSYRLFDSKGQDIFQLQPIQPNYFERKKSLSWFFDVAGSPLGLTFLSNLDYLSGLFEPPLRQL